MLSSWNGTGFYFDFSFFLQRNFYLVPLVGSYDNLCLGWSGENLHPKYFTTKINVFIKLYQEATNYGMSPENSPLKYHTLIITKENHVFLPYKNTAARYFCRIFIEERVKWLISISVVEATSRFLGHAAFFILCKISLGSPFISWQRGETRFWLKYILIWLYNYVLL